MISASRMGFAGRGLQPGQRCGGGARRGHLTQPRQAAAHGRPTPSSPAADETLQVCITASDTLSRLRSNDAL